MTTSEPPVPVRSDFSAWLASLVESDSPCAKTRRMKLARAVKRGDIEAVSAQLKLHPTDVALVDDAGQTPLFYARDPLMVDLLCMSGADKQARDLKGRTALMAFSEEHLQNLALQLLLNGYNVSTGAKGSAQGGNNGVGRYDSDLVFAVLSKDYLLLELLLTFGIDLDAEKDAGELKHLTLKQWEKNKKDWAINYIHNLLDKFGEPDRDEDRELAAQVPNRPELRVPHRHSKSLQQFLAEKNASYSLKRRFCRLLLAEQQFSSLKEVLTPSEAERLEILEGVYEDALTEEQEMGPIPKTKSFRLLSLDGGGMKGIVPTHVLLHIAKRLHDEFGGLNFTEQIDMFAATSTGSLVSAQMLVGHSLDDTRKTYFLLKDKIFSNHGLGERTKVFEELLKTRVPPTIKMDESYGLRKQYLMVTTTRMDVEPVSPCFFRNFTYGDLKRKSWRDEHIRPSDEPGPDFLWEAVRCSAAAPTYFEPYRWKDTIDPKAINGKERVFSDGGLMNNNPTLQAFTEVSNLLRTINRHKTGAEVTRLTAVLSLGCSHRGEKEVDSDTLNQLSHLNKPTNLLDYLSFAFFARGLTQLMSVLEESATGTTSGVDEAQAWSHSLGAGFLRFDPLIPFDVELDTTKSEMLVAMLLSTEFQLRARADQIEAFCILLALDPRDNK